METRHAQPEDLEKIIQVIDEARAIMRETGNTTQWTNGYPSAETLLGDIRNGHGFVCCENGELVGYFAFMYGKNPEPTYELIEGGNWLNDDAYGVIHRLASGRKVRGVAKACFDFAFSQAANIRVDTLHENLPMQNFLRKEGFTYCGIIYVSDGTPRDAFQKMRPEAAL